jgi:hypothetical protein
MNLTPESIISIIEKCSGTVKRIKIHGKNIEIEFIEPHQPIKSEPSTHNQGQYQVSGEIIPIPPDKVAPEVKDEGIEQEVLDTAELIDELNVINPSQMEDLIALKEVVRGEENQENR